MAQEENYIAVVSERLSKPGDTRYVIIDKQTQQEVDTCNGRGYKSPQSAHKSFSFKQRQRQNSVHAYRSTPDGQGRPTNRGQAAYGQTARQVPMNGQPASGNSQPRDLVSPFVRDDMAPTSVCESLSTTSPNRQPAVSASRQPAVNGQRLSLTSRFSPHRWTSQENTPRPLDLFDFSK